MPYVDACLLISATTLTPGIRSFFMVPVNDTSGLVFFPVVFWIDTTQSVEFFFLHGVCCFGVDSAAFIACCGITDRDTCFDFDRHSYTFLGAYFYRSRYPYKIIGVSVLFYDSLMSNMLLGSRRSAMAFFTVSHVTVLISWRSIIVSSRSPSCRSSRYWR